MTRRLTLLALAGIVSAIAAQAAAQNCRFHLAGQYEWEEKRGFYLAFEGCELAELPIVLGVADGENWRFISHDAPLYAGESYAVRAVITPEIAELYIDDELVEVSEGGFMPHDGPLRAGFPPDWGTDLGDYIMTQESISARVERGGEEAASVDVSLAEAAARPASLQIFQRGGPTEVELDVQPGDTLTVEATVRPEVYDLVAMSPVIDRFGQNDAADWPGKITNERQLLDDIASESQRLAAMPPSADYDEFGGYLKAGWTADATGFFRVTKRDGYWWLITPEGNPCFYVGVCAAPGARQHGTPVTDREYLFEELPPTAGAWADCWRTDPWGEWEDTEYASFYRANLIRKYGPRWEELATERCVDRLRAWGFHGGGKWGSPPDMAHAPDLWSWATPNLVHHPDVWDDAVVEKFKQNLEEQMVDGIDDPYIIGWSFGNEKDQAIKRSEIADIMKMDADVPARKALVDHLIEARGVDPATLASEQPELSDELLESCREFYQDAYYRTIYRLVKEIDPDHMYLGNWVAFEWWEGEADWEIMARHCDVIGYDRYGLEYENDLLQRLQKEADKPVICGEFGFPPWYDGTRGFGRYHVSVRDDSEAGERYRAWMKSAAEDPYCVGMMFFLYGDQELTGRGPGKGEKPFFGEHVAFGMVDITDRPKWDLVTPMREANLSVAEWRLAAPN